MKQNEIQQGGIYFAKVSGRIVKIKVNNIYERADFKGRSQTFYECTNLFTSKQIRVKSAMRFRSTVLKSDNGSVLLVTMFICAILGFTMASYLLLIQSTLQASYRSDAWNSAMPIAEAGIEE